MTTSVEHPFLHRLEPESIRVFLRKYDGYCRELKARAAQLSSESSVSLEPARPVGIIYCVDAEQLESAVECGLIPDCQDVEDLEDDDLRTFLEKEAEESPTVITQDELSKIVESTLRMDMSVKSAKGRMKLLFKEYTSMLRTNGLKWVTEKTPKVAIKQVLSVIKPASLRERLEQDIGFSHSHLKNDYTGFMRHATDLSDAFERVDTGPPRARKHDRGDHRGKNEKSTGQKGTSSGTAGLKADKKSGKQPKKQPPGPCPLPPCKGKNRIHWISDCTESTEEDKKTYRDELAASKARDGPSRSTRSQTAEASKSVKRVQAGTDANDKGQPSCRMTVQDNSTSLDITGRCDDGSDVSLASKEVAEKAVLQGIGKFESIKTVNLEVALKKTGEGPPVKFPFSRAWTVPSTVLHLSAGQMALKNIRYLVADDSLTCEDILIGLPVLRHLRVDTRTLLEDNYTSLHGTDCALNDSETQKTGKLGRIMSARLNQIQETDKEPSEKIDPARPKVNYHKARTEEDPFPDPSLLDLIDKDQHDEIKAAVKGMEQAAKKQGLADVYESNLKGILHDHMDIFRTSFSAGPGAKLPPLKIELTPDAKPVKVRLRKYSQDQEDFMRKFVDDLVANGLAYANPTSKWACAPLLVPKIGGPYRFTIDIRPVNLFTIKHHFPMPNLDIEITKVKSSKYFANFDMSHGYWQLLLDVMSQECQSFITPFGIYTPTRVIHGTTNAVTHLQSSMMNIIPENLRPFLLIWLDDILIHAPTVENLMQSIQSFFGLCAEYNIKLHPAKCTVFAKEIRWCGRLISADGIRYDPRRLEGLLNMEPPTTGAHLQQFVCALQWVKQGIPNFTELILPLHNFLERIYDDIGKRTKRAVSRVLLEKYGWGEPELIAFQSCKNALANQVTLSHRDPEQRLCVYTDASDFSWSGIITQVPKNDVCKPHKEQRHSPISFLSGKFDATQLGWSTLEKEAFAVMNTLDKMHWVVCTTEGFDLYTDHNNLIFLFDPLAVVPDLSQTSLRKVLRWAVKLSIYSYTCYHIKGEENVWADLLTRWSVPQMTIRRLVHIPELPTPCTEEFEWPTPSKIAEVQAEHTSSRTDELTQHEDLWTFPDGRIWIPEDASDLQLRLCIIAHCGPAGHRGRKATEQALRSKFKWSTLTEDVQAFVRACIHCLSTVGGEKVPRPFGPAVHGTKPNDLVQFDYIDLGPSKTGDKYVLMLRDDHSAYKWFFCFPSTDAENAATAIIEWCSTFGVPNALMSDGPTHFKNEVVHMVTKILKVPHHFTLPYCPWSNGAVERLGRELLRVLRSTLSELQMDHQEWPDLIPIVQSVLNNAPSPQRGNISPITAFMGREPTPPIQTFLRTSTSKPVSLTELQLESMMNVEELLKLCAEIHPRVQSSLDKHRAQHRQNASRGQLPNFDEGDYVLVARSDFHAGEKLCLRWRGPRRIKKAMNDYVYQIEDLRNGQLNDIHASRLKLFRDSDIDETAIMSHVLQSETGMVVSRLLGLEDTAENGLQVRVRWKGLGQDEDSLEPLSRVAEDVPTLFEKMLKRKSTPKNLVAKARAQLAL